MGMFGFPLITAGGPAAAAGGGVRPTRGGDPSYFFPATGSAVIITAPDGASWSAENELSAAVPGDCVISTVWANVSHGIGGAEARSLFIRLSVGAAGAEVPIGTWYDKCTAIAIHNYDRQWRLNGRLLPSGTRLTAAIRLDVASGGSNRHQAAIAVCAPPSPVLFTDDWNEDTYMQGGVDEEELVPTEPDFASVPCGAIDTWGSPVEIIASAAERALIYGVNVRASGTPPPPYSLRLAVQVGIGASGSEVWHEAVQMVSATSAGPSGVAVLPRPVEVLTGERVAARTQTGRASQAVSLQLVRHNLNF